MSEKTRAPVPKKPSRGAGKGMNFLAGLSERPTFTADNMQTTRLKDLSFKVDHEFHRRFKATATQHGLSMKEFLEQCLAAWEKQNRE